MNQDELLSWNVEYKFSLYIMDNVNEPKLEQFLSYNMPINFKLQIEVN